MRALRSRPPVPASLLRHSLHSGPHTGRHSDQQPGHHADLQGAKQSPHHCLEIWRSIVAKHSGKSRPADVDADADADTAANAADTAVPAIAPAAVQRLGEDTVVFVPTDEEGGFRAVDVVIGARSRGIAEVLSGLAVGERYVSEGAFVLKSELSRSQLGDGHAH